MLLAYADYLEKMVLIETLWNVKIAIRRGGLRRTIVLIETLWNVKTDGLQNIKIFLVLIETLWNVKHHFLSTVQLEGQY